MVIILTVLVMVSNNSVIIGNNINSNGNGNSSVNITVQVATERKKCKNSIFLRNYAKSWLFTHCQYTSKLLLLPATAKQSGNHKIQTTSQFKLTNTP